MNQKVEVNTLEKTFIKRKRTSRSKRKRKPLGEQQWKHQHRFDRSNDSTKMNPNHSNTSARLLKLYNLDNSKNSYPNWRNDSNLPCGSSGVSSSETGFKTDVSHCLNVAGSSTTGEFRNEEQEMSTCELNSSDVLQFESNVFENEKGFQDELRILLEACKSRHSQIQNKDFYNDKIKSLHKNHIQVLLEERKKCNGELAQAQTKRRKNRLVILKRLEAMRNALNSLERYSGLLLNNFIEEQRQIIKDIMSKLFDSVCCDMYRHYMNKDATKELNSIKKQENIHRQLLQTEMELMEVKKQLEDKVNTIQQHTDYEQKRNLEINKLKEDVNRYKIQLIQAQNFREAVCKGFDEINVVQPSIENDANVNILVTETESDFEEVPKDSDNSNIFSKSAPSQQKGVIYLDDEKKANVSSEPVAVAQSQPQAFRKENSASAIQETFNLEEKDKAELSKLQTYLAKTPQVLEVAKRIVSSRINIIQQNVQHEQKTMEQLNKAEADIKALRNQLAQTQNELAEVKKELNDKIQIVQQTPLPEQKEMELCTVKTVELLQSELTGTQQVLENVKKILNSKINIIAQKVRHEKKIKIQLNESEGDKKILQDRLAQTQNKLEELNKEIELRKSKEDGLLQNQLTLTQNELEATRKCVDYNLNKFMEKNQQVQKITKELNEAEENRKLLRIQLVETQHESETVRKEFDDRVNVIQQEQFEKAIEIELSKIWLILINKLGSTDQNDQHFEMYMKERSSRGIASDIQRLIEDKVQLRNETIPEAVIHSNILQVTENELHLLILVASVLKVVPFSASTDFIYSFVAEVDNVISRQHVENLLKKYPTFFKEESVGAGSSNKNWRYLYLKPIITI